MNIEQIKKYLKHLQGDGNLYSFTVWSDGSGFITDIDNSIVFEWDTEKEMCHKMLGYILPEKRAKKALFEVIEKL